MSDYDVIVIGSGAGGGTLVHRLAPSGKRILLLERGDWLPREPQNWRAEDVFVDNRYVSPDTWYDADGKPFQPQVHYFVGGATKLYGAALYRLRAEDFGELRHHDGVSPAWPISYDELEPYYTQAEQLYQVHGARGEDPTEPPASAPYPFPAVSHEPRIQQLSDDLAAAGHHPFHAPCGIMLERGQHALQPLRPLPRLRRLPVPGARQVRRRGASRCGRRSSTRTSPCSRTRRPCSSKRTRPAPPSPRSWSSATARPRRYAGDVVVVSCGAANSAKLLSAVGERQASERPRQRLRPGRSQLHVPRQRGGAGAVARGEPDRLPEDARAQRLLLRQRRLRVPARQHPDGRQVPGPDVPGREAGGDEAGAGVDARADRPSRGRLLALDRGPAAVPTTASSVDRRREVDAELHRDQRDREEAALRQAQVDARTPRHALGPPVHAGTPT